MVLEPRRRDRRRRIGRALRRLTGPTRRLFHGALKGAQPRGA
jgi:hypothetical protein